MASTNRTQAFPPNPNQLLFTTKETARLIDQAEQTLHNNRLQRKGLPYVKLGKSIRYALEDILKYISDNKVQF